MLFVTQRRSVADPGFRFGGDLLGGGGVATSHAGERTKELGSVEGRAPGTPFLDLPMAMIVICSKAF